MRPRRGLACGILLGLVTAPVAPDDGAIIEDRTAQVGVDFVHRNGAAGELYLPEIIGAGAALFDADRDGDLDLYLVQSGSFEGGRAPSASDRLYRNELTRYPDGGRHGHTRPTLLDGLVKEDAGVSRPPRRPHAPSIKASASALRNEDVFGDLDLSRSQRCGRGSQAP